MCADFYGYDIALKETLLKMGAKNVYLYSEGSGFFYGRFTLKTPYHILKDPHKQTNKTKELIEKIDNTHFDYLLCIEYTPFKKWFINWLRERDPNIKCILFLWDRVKDSPKEQKGYLPLFDKVWSFDRDDCKRFGFTYQPDFYLENGTCPYDDCEYDISFVGSMGDGNKRVYDRPAILSYIDRFCKEHKLNAFLYLRYTYVKSRSLKYFGIPDEFEKVLGKYKNESFMHLESIPLAKVQEIQKHSKVILDLAHDNRQGLTINAITALATGKKLITTNKRIKDESFYSERNVLILDPKKLSLSADFFIQKPQVIHLENLRMDNWLRTILTL